MEDARDGRLLRARAGDVDAFTSLIRECDEGMRALVFSLVRDRWLMDDVLQLAYEKAFRKITSFRGDSSFRTWLHRVCWTTAVDVMRAESRRRQVPIDEVEHRPCPAPGPAVCVESRLAWDQAWGSLEPDHRAALVLVVQEGLTYEEAAEVFGVRPGTVASRVSRARMRLRQSLGEDGVAESPRSTGSTVAARSSRSGAEVAGRGKATRKETRP